MIKVINNRRPVMTYDGGCGFCRYWIKRWLSITDDRLYYFPYQKIAHFFPNIPEPEFKKSVQLIELDGHRYSGAAAVFKALTYSKNWRWLWWLYQFIPGFAVIAELIYRFVSDHRPFFGKVLRLLRNKTGLFR